MSERLILLTTDFSAESRRAYQHAIGSAQRRGARILLLHVVEATRSVPRGAPLAPAQYPPGTEQEVEEAERKLAAEIELFGEQQVEPIVLVDDSVVHAMMHLAEERGVEVIVISTHGRTGLRRLVLGSVAEQVVRHSAVPVFCIPAH